jgi:hypothetical protein
MQSVSTGCWVLVLQVRVGYIGLGAVETDAISLYGGCGGVCGGAGAGWLARLGAVETDAISLHVGK